MQFLSQAEQVLKIVEGHVYVEIKILTPENVVRVEL